MSENKKYDGINEGTKIKAILQLRAIEFLKEYEPKQTLDFYAKLLCWDIHTTYRTALDSYIMPMLCHGYFIYNGDDKYTFNENRKSNSKIKKGKITKDSVENQESATDFMKRRNEEKKKEKEIPRITKETKEINESVTVNSEKKEEKDKEIK